MVVLSGAGGEALVGVVGSGRGRSRLFGVGGGERKATFFWTSLDAGAAMEVSLVLSLVFLRTTRAGVACSGSGCWGGGRGEGSSFETD